MRLFLGGVELFDKSRGGDETRHRYLTHSEWHTDSKFVGLLKVGYQTSILEIKSKKMYYKLIKGPGPGLGVLETVLSLFL